MFGVGSYATIWKVENKGNYDVCQISTQKKNKETGLRETDFSDKVRFVGKAHGQHPQAGQKIKITNCGVTNKYDKEKKKMYIQYLIFDYELCGQQPQQASNTIEEDLPFIF